MYRYPIALSFLMATLALFSTGCDSNEPQGELIIEDLTVGQGMEAVAGKRLTVHYIGTFEDGRMFDSSYTRDAPFLFTLGARQVIQGWDEGLVGMRVGGKRRLTIPPHLAYGSRGQGQIPGGATLIFEVDLLDVSDP